MQVVLVPAALYIFLQYGFFREIKLNHYAFWTSGMYSYVGDARLSTLEVGENVFRSDNSTEGLVGVGVVEIDGGFSGILLTGFDSFSGDFSGNAGRAFDVLEGGGLNTSSSSTSSIEKMLRDISS
jgi:hypothetical protein